MTLKCLGELEPSSCTPRNASDSREPTALEHMDEDEIPSLKETPKRLLLGSWAVFVFAFIVGFGAALTLASFQASARWDLGRSGDGLVRYCGFLAFAPIYFVDKANFLARPGATMAGVLAGFACVRWIASLI